MRRILGSPRTLVVLTLAPLVYVLGLYGDGAAQSKKTPPPFANSVEQQSEMIQLLREIRQELKQQNALLASGRLTVVVQNDVKK